MAADPQAPTLHQRIQRLEDIEAIKRLKADYADACDRGYDAAAYAALFTEDGVWESNVYGTYKGREAIFKFMDGADRATPWIVHFITNARIDVDGDTATATFYLLETARVTDGLSAPDGDAVLATAKYVDQFVRIDGRWYFQHVNARWHQVSNLDQGWIKQRFRSEATSWDQ